MRKKINIAIVGFGNIGSYFYKTLAKNQKKIAIKTGKIPSIKYICVKNINKKRSIQIPKSKRIKNPLLLTSKKDVDLIVELVGGAEGVAKKLIFSALRNKKHVITANKSLIAKYGDELAHIAEKNKVNLEANIINEKYIDSSVEFSEFVKKIHKKNLPRSYPDINDIPK